MQPFSTTPRRPRYPRRCWGCRKQKQPPRQPCLFCRASSYLQFLSDQRARMLNQQVNRRRSSTLGGHMSPQIPSSPTARKQSVNLSFDRSFDRKSSVTIPESSLDATVDLEEGSAKLGKPTSENHIAAPGKRVIFFLAVVAIGLVTTALLYPQYASSAGIQSKASEQSQVAGMDGPARAGQELQKAFAEEDSAAAGSKGAFWPVVYIPGAQRAAISSLSAKLNDHPAFCSRFSHGAKDKQHINEAEFVATGCVKPGLWKETERTLAVDASPSLHVFGAADELVARIPKDSRAAVKFVVVLREPVAADYSHFAHAKAAANSTAFADYSRGEYDMFVLDRVAGEEAQRSTPLTQTLTMGHYAEHLERFFAAFDRRNVLVLNYEALVRNQADSLIRIANFLGIDAEPWASDSPLPHLGTALEATGAAPSGKSRGKAAAQLPTGVATLDPLVCRRLAQYYAPHNQRLYALLERGPSPKEQPSFREFQLPCLDKTSQVYGVGKAKTSGIKPPGRARKGTASG